MRGLDARYYAHVLHSGLVNGVDDLRVFETEAFGVGLGGEDAGGLDGVEEKRGGDVVRGRAGGGEGCGEGG